MGEVSILGFKKAQVFCIKNSSCVKTGKSLRAIETSVAYFVLKKAVFIKLSCVWKQVRAWGRLKPFLVLIDYWKIGKSFSVKTGKSLRAIAEIWEWGLENAE